MARGQLKTNIPLASRRRPELTSQFWGMAEVCNSACDFLLFPQEHSYLDTLDLRTGDDYSSLHFSSGTASDMHRHRDWCGRDLPGHPDTSHEAYLPVSAYSAPSFRAPYAPLEGHKGTIGQSLQRNPSTETLSRSGSQTFDHPPSTLSSASGASAHSTASSTDGSPYANATHSLPYQEKWPEPLHGLGIAPGIVNGESFNNDQFPSANFENDLMLEDSKFPNYVGEYRNSSLPSISMSFPMLSSIPSAPSPQGVVTPFSSPSLALDTTANARDTTIDSILKEANSRVQNSTHLISPVSAASETASPTISTERYQRVSSPERKASFRSPRTPASAVSCFASPECSPHGPDGHIIQSQVAIFPDHVGSQSGSQPSARRFHPYHRPTSTLSSHGQAPFEKTQNPFFGQSSGRFVAPLESSCWFSLLSPSLPSTA